jgi:hypothetical protein
MSGDSSGEHERLSMLEELEPELRQRIVALDEPIARDDWGDVVRRSRVHLPFTIKSAAIAAVIATGALAVGPGVAYHLLSGLSRSPTGATTSTSLAPSQSTPHAQTAVDSAVPTPTTIGFTDNSGRSLSVSLRKTGGFCYRWTGTPRACGTLETTPLRVSWNNGRLIGSVSSNRLSSVQIKFTDGTVTAPQISWITAPVNAGFFLYTIPPGKIVADITGYNGHQTIGQVTWFAL